MLEKHQKVKLWEWKALRFGATWRGGKLLPHIQGGTVTLLHSTTPPHPRRESKKLEALLVDTTYCVALHV
jgi:hypothetical protein